VFRSLPNFRFAWPSPSCAFTALPILNQFGELLLLTAESPVRLPAEGQYRPGNRLAKAVYRSNMHKKNQKPLWGEELV
jgi:hypothetical protein